MKGYSVRLFMGLICTMFVIGGCAKQGVVKSDAPMMPKTTAADKSGEERLKTEKTKVDKLKAEELKAASPTNELKKGSSKESVSLKPIPAAGQLKVALDAIYFDFDSSALSQRARNALVRDAELMKKDPKLTVRIEGNCDERGSDEYNLALGESRAKSAMQYLVTMGIPEKRLSVISYGKEKPVALGHDENSWAKNRRDEFVITMQ